MISKRKLIWLAVGLMGFLLIVMAGIGVGLTAPLMGQPVGSPTLSTSEPAPSSNDAPSSNQKPEFAQPNGTPTRVEVTSASGKILARAPIKAILLDKDGALAPPSGLVGWYNEPGWPKPGESSPQRAVLAGHDAFSGKPDTFYDLPKVRAGDEVRVAFDSGDIAVFRVIKDAHPVPKDKTVDTTSYPWVWFSPSEEPEQVISLITCDLTAKHVGGRSVNNVVVQATRVA